MTSPLLQTVHVRNFKALRDTDGLKLSPLTVFIGNNGSGKSSVIEALECFYLILTEDLDSAFQSWHGIEHVRNKIARTRRRRSKDTGEDQSTKPISFQLSGHTGQKPFQVTSVINERGNENLIFVDHEEAKVGSIVAKRDERGRMDVRGKEQTAIGPIADSESILRHVRFFGDYVRSWQFLNLTPSSMGEPRPSKRTLGRIVLAKEGSNIGEYLLDIRRQDLQAFNGIVESLQYVLPYAADVQPTLL